MRSPVMQRNASGISECKESHKASISRSAQTRLNNDVYSNSVLEITLIICSSNPHRREWLTGHHRPHSGHTVFCSPTLQPSIIPLIWTITTHSDIHCNLMLLFNERVRIYDGHVRKSHRARRAKLAPASSDVDTEDDDRTMLERWLYL